MPRVGNLNLTDEEKKRTFHLPVEQAVIVPSTSGVKSQRVISKAEMSTRVNNVRRFLAQRFGGYTSVKAVGGFVLKNGKLVREDAVKVTSFATNEDFKKHKPGVINQVGSWGRKWKQESVSYEHEGDLFIVEPPKSGPVKSMMKVLSQKKMRKVNISVKKTRKKIPASQLKVMMVNLAKARRARKK